MSHVRLALPGDPPLPGGNLLPDTCADARLVVPVAGRARFTLHLPAGTHAPATLALRAGGRTLFAAREHAGAREATYGVWLDEGRAGATVALDGSELGLWGRASIALRADGPAFVDLR
jgi:hypothetical protein